MQPDGPCVQKVDDALRLLDDRASELAALQRKGSVRRYTELRRARPTCLSVRVRRANATVHLQISRAGAGAYYFREPDTNFSWPFGWAAKVPRERAADFVSSVAGASLGERDKYSDKPKLMLVGAPTWVTAASVRGGRPRCAKTA